MNVRRSLPLALTVVATAVLATACSATGTVAGGSGASQSASAGTGAASSAPTSGATGGSTGGGAAPISAPTKPGSGSGTSAGGNATSDSYAWKHPCAPGQISIEVQYQPSLGTSRRVIVATNHGSAACGLSYFPTVAVSDSSSIGGTSSPARFVNPKVPGGLGGAPYSPIYAGHSAYAVLDLNPSHTAAGASHLYNEIDVLASDFMPNAATTNHPVKAQPAGTGNPDVKAPVLSLYQPTVADAVSQVGNPGNFK